MAVSSRSDVEAAIAGGTGKAPASEAAEKAAAAARRRTGKGMSDDAVLKLFEEGSYELVKHDGMRKTIAKRLTGIQADDPAFLCVGGLRTGCAAQAAGELNKAAPVKDDKPAYKLSVNDMVIKALALALRDVPDANVSWTDENMVMHKHADVGVAVSIPGGLITPIIRRPRKAAVGHLQRDEGPRQARQGPQAASPRNTRAARRRSPTWA
jgi:pyruvate dehydrogenase E2 component (dihydrolipoamide acetyltransferase)